MGSYSQESAINVSASGQLLLGTLDDVNGVIDWRPELAFALGDALESRTGERALMMTTALKVGVSLRYDLPLGFASSVCAPLKRPSLVLFMSHPFARRWDLGFWVSSATERKLYTGVAC